MQSLDPVPDNYTSLIDMGFIWRLATPSAENREKDDGAPYICRDYSRKVFDTILKRHPNASKIFFVNDPYDLDIITIKDSERERRADSHPDRNVS